MATYSVASFASSFPTVYTKLVTTTQRKVPTLRLLSDLRRLLPNYSGDKMRWTVRFSGQTSGAVNADGGNLLTAAADDRQPAALAFGTYGAPIQVTDDIRRKAQASAGVPAQFNTFDMIVGQNAMEAMEALLKTINQALFSGSGTAPEMTGMAAAVAATGSYAGIAQSSYSAWASTVQANGGTLRSLTIALLKTHLRTVGVSSPMGRPNLGICTPALFDTLEALFTPYTMLPFAPSGGAVSPGAERATMNPATINLPGGQIQNNGFRVLHWASAGVYFVEDPDCTDTGASNAANTIFHLNSDDVEVDYPPPATMQDGVYNIPAQRVTPSEQGLGPLGDLPLEMMARGRQNMALNWDITAWVGLKLQARNAHGKLQDVQ